MEGIVLLRKGADAEKVLAALHQKIDYVNQYVLPPGVKIVPYLDRSDLVHNTTRTVLHNRVWVSRSWWWFSSCSSATSAAPSSWR